MSTKVSKLIHIILVDLFGRFRSYYNIQLFKRILNVVLLNGLIVYRYKEIIGT